MRLHLLTNKLTNLKMRKFYALLIMLLVGLSTNAFAQCTSCSLNGPSSIQRGSTATFSTGSLSGTSYFWSVTGGLQLMSGNTGTSVTVKANSGTTGKVCVARYGNAKVPCSYCKTITITDPNNCTLSSVTVQRISGSCNSNTLTYRATPNGTNLTGVSYDWTALGDNVSIVSGQGTNTVTISASGFNEFVGARATVTACGGTSKSGVSAEFCGNPCGQFICKINAFPNPSQESFTVHINKGQKALNARIAQDITIQLLNKHGEVVKEVKSSKSEVTIDTEGLSNGLYFVRAIDPAGTSQTESVMINK